MTRDEFHRLVWSTPVTEIADMFNVMPGDVREVIALFEVPLPGRGHWIQTDGRQAPSKAPPLASHSRPEALPSVWPLQKPGKAKSGRYGLFVPQVAPRALHPVAKATAAAIRQAPEPTSIVVDAPGTFPCRTKAEDGERAICFVDALLKLFDRLGFAISSDDALEVQCFGIWFAFDLTYRSMPAGRDRSKNDKKVLEVRPLSPAFVGRQWGAFYGRGDKPIEATFNTMLLWLMHTARAIQDAEAGWSDDRQSKEGSRHERFEARRERFRLTGEKLRAAAEEKKATAERLQAAKVAWEEKSARLEHERRALEVKRREAEIEELRVLLQPAAPELENRPISFMIDRSVVLGPYTDDAMMPPDLGDRLQANHVERDQTARMTRQEQFLWIVQTLFLVSAQRQATGRRFGTLRKGHISHADLDICQKAIAASMRIPAEMSVDEAAFDLVTHVLPVFEEERRAEDYDTPEWTGFLSKAEHAVYTAETVQRSHRRPEERSDTPARKRARARKRTAG